MISGSHKQAISSSAKFYGAFTSLKQQKERKSTCSSSVFVPVSLKIGMVEVGKRQNVSQDFVDEQLETSPFAISSLSDVVEEKAATISHSSRHRLSLKRSDSLPVTSPTSSKVSRADSGRACQQRDRPKKKSDC